MPINNGKQAAIRTNVVSPTMMTAMKTIDRDVSWSSLWSDDTDNHDFSSDDDDDIGVLLHSSSSLRNLFGTTERIHAWYVSWLVLHEPAQREASK